MKKLAFMFVAMMAISFVSCNEKPAAPAEEPTEEVADTTAADTVAADTVAADSAAAE